EGERPVKQVGTLEAAIGGFGLELVVLQTERGARPMHRRAADRLDDPGRQIGKVAVHTPRARRRAHVLPGQLREAIPFVVNEILDLKALAGFENDDLDALVREFVGERAAAGAGANDDNDRVVGLIEFRSHWIPPIRWRATAT